MTGSDRNTFKDAGTLLESKTTDPYHKAAQRAIRALNGIAYLQRQAVNRGDIAEFEACEQAMQAGNIALGMVQNEMKYPFVEIIVPRIDNRVPTLTDVTHFLEMCERGHGELKHRIKPAMGFTGSYDIGCAILRGFTAAMMGGDMAPDNDLSGGVRH
jgi:hypothetical protein